MGSPVKDFFTFFELPLQGKNDGISNITEEHEGKSGNNSLLMEKENYANDEAEKEGSLKELAKPVDIKIHPTINSMKDNLSMTSRNSFQNAQNQRKHIK